jgi:NitT/TauT family transport system substrate-binding protein
MPIMQTRRRFLTAVSLAGAAGIVRLPPVLAGEGGLETTTVRIGKNPGICVAPQYVAEELMRAEGFTDVRYVEEPATATEPLAHGKVDFDMNYASNFVRAIDAGEPITLLTGVMVGCFELFGSAGIRNINDLKGKSVGIQALASNPHALLTLMAAQVGLDPTKDIHWITDPAVKPIQLFEQGKIDAFLGFPPEPQDLAPAASAMSSSIPLWTAHGPNISAAFWGQCGLRAGASGCNQAGHPRGPESRGFVRRGSRACRTAAGR